MGTTGQIILVVLGFVAAFVIIATAGEIINRLISLGWPLLITGGLGLVALLGGLALGRSTVATLGGSVVVGSIGAGIVHLAVKRRRSKRRW